MKIREVFDKCEGRLHVHDEMNYKKNNVLVRRACSLDG